MSESKKIEFSKQEIERYSRHLIIPEFNIEGQRKLKAAKVLVVGTGGLGAPLLQYLTAAGVGKIGVVDFDVVDESNLQRQVLFQVEDIGKHKVDVAIERLRGLNPHIEFVGYKQQLTSENALEIVKAYEVVADGTDNFPTRYLVNDACVLLGIANVYASIFRFEGQVAVFNLKQPDGSFGPNYRDIFPSPPPPGMVPSCAEGGVLGVLPGIIGSLQANEVIKVITGIGEPLSGKLHLVDALTLDSRTVSYGKDPNREEITKLIDYDQFCGLNGEPMPHQSGLKSVTVEDLQAMRENGNYHLLIDVREPYEYEIANLGGKLIPQQSIEDRLQDIPKVGNVVVHCRSGVRSAQTISLLQEKYGYSNLYNLDGGILAWARRIDLTMPKY